ncbi:CAF17-like 4Fe-4S cluster assembly/insertion protein YgfZ [Hydrogenophaga sp. OTU3427]|uniref:CAF17-like 4Fe-4S cluster assembly/insertion protein YgfZ n=1 Tax=Hydrogenophaga sp. OTU3427 TaxID=3043856 RepID=UPI00313E5715
MTVTSAPLLPLPTFDASTVSGAARLPQLGVIRVVGEDAASFLHGQLTQDFALLGLSQARLAAFCSAKGRMLASFVGFKRSHTEVWLVCAQDLLAPTLKRLSMFVLRAKAKLSDASAELAVYGLVGDGAGWPATAWSKQDDGEASVVRLMPAEGRARALWVAPVEAAAPALPALDPALWQWLAVRSGVADLSAPVVEAFVPQMLNYESVDGVNFKKGCYPGQEVVARSQFRGTLKRRAYLAHADAPMAVGQDVFHASDAEQPTGTVVAAAPHPVAGFDAVVSMQISAADGQALTLAAADGPALQLLPLPYPLRDDI